MSIYTEEEIHWFFYLNGRSVDDYRSVKEVIDAGQKVTIFYKDNGRPFKLKVNKFSKYQPRDRY